MRADLGCLSAPHPTAQAFAQLAGDIALHVSQHGDAGGCAFNDDVHLGDAGIAAEKIFVSHALPPGETLPRKKQEKDAGVQLACLLLCLLNLRDCRVPSHNGPRPRVPLRCGQDGVPAGSPECCPSAILWPESFLQVTGTPSAAA